MIFNLLLTVLLFAYSWGKLVLENIDDSEFFGEFLHAYPNGKCIILKGMFGFRNKLMVISCVGRVFLLPIIKQGVQGMYL